VVAFDASASVGYRNVLGVLTPDPTYIATYTWDFGDGSPIVTVDTPIITHAYTNMGTYTVILRVTDLDGRNGTVSQEVEVILERLIDVFIGTGTGPYPAPYGGQGPDKVADMFEPQKTVCVYANVTYNGDPVQSKLVTFIVISPHNLHDFSRTAITNGTGYAYIEFGLPWPCVDPVNEIFGIWNITVKVDIRSQVVEDTVAFKVWWLIDVTEVVPKATEFVKGDLACFNITFRTYRMQPIDTVLEISVYDDLNVSFGSVRVELGGIGWGNYTWCQFKEYNCTFCIEVPKWAFVGTGTAYVNFFHYDPTNPYNMGSPYCPEQQATFKILKAP
jgi:PKD repeat protein